jgi:Dullard-like phosphatase family protein
MALTAREQEIGSVQIPKLFHSTVPKGENNHWNKNPFLKGGVHEIEAANPLDSKGSESFDEDSVANEAFGYIVRCQSGFKSSLKTKSWTIEQVPKPDEEENKSANIQAEVTEEAKSRLETIFPDQPPEALVEHGPDQLSMEGEVLELAANIDFKARLTRRLCNSFRVVAALPPILAADLQARCVQLPPRKPKRSNKTLFLDLEGTLICTATSSYDRTTWTRILYKSQETEESETAYVRARPGIASFLATVAPLYECVVFTEAEPDFVFEVVQRLLDPNDLFIDYILTKDNCVRQGEVYLKDLRVITNRELQDMVILDDSLVSFCYQLDNGIQVQRYEGKKTDQELRKITSLLQDLAQAPDVRPILRRVFILPELLRVYLEETVSIPSSTSSY